LENIFQFQSAGGKYYQISLVRYFIQRNKNLPQNLPQNPLRRIAMMLIKWNYNFCPSAFRTVSKFPADLADWRRRI